MAAPGPARGACREFIPRGILPWGYYLGNHHRLRVRWSRCHMVKLLLRREKRQLVR